MLSSAEVFPALLWKVTKTSQKLGLKGAKCAQSPEMPHFQPQPGWGVREGMQHPGVSTGWVEGQTLSPLGQATGQGQAMGWGAVVPTEPLMPRWPHGWLSLFALGTTTGTIKHRVTLGTDVPLPSPWWDALLPWSSSAFLHLIFLQPHLPGLA